MEKTKLTNLLGNPTVTKIRRQITVLLFLSILITGCSSSTVTVKPLKVYILVGQSNMQGHAKTATFDYMALDPVTAPILKEMRNADGGPRVCDKVWISAIGVSEQEKHGKLTVGYGAENSDPKIGPEFTFGIYMQKIVDEPILIIKTAWGGKSLHTDFRSPSAGQYVLNDFQRELYQHPGRHGVPKDLDKWKADKAKATGVYYRLMTDHVKKVLADIKRVCPVYDEKQGYELAGFVWFQGWNDMVDSHTYPDRNKPGGYDMYSELLAHFIRDLRKDLSAPKMPFVIGVMGVGGVKKSPAGFQSAMAAPAALPEFKDNVTAVWTGKYWDAKMGELAAKWDKVKSKRRTMQKAGKLTRQQQQEALDKYIVQLYTPQELALYRKGTSNAAYHYLGSAKIMAQIGKAFAEALAE